MCRLQETDRSNSPAEAQSPGKFLAHSWPPRDLRDTVVTAVRVREVNSYRGGPYELDHLGSSAGRVAPDRAGHSLRVRPLHPCSGRLGTRGRSLASGAPLPAPREARKSVAARSPQDAPRSRRRPPRALVSRRSPAVPAIRPGSGREPLQSIAGADSRTEHQGETMTRIARLLSICALAS